LRVVSGLDETTYPDFLAVDDIIVSGPNGDLQFSDVANLKAATPLNQKSYKVSWAGQLGRKVSTVVHNTTSNEGGAEYVIVNVNPSNLSTLVGGVWVGANHDLGGGFYAKLQLNNNEINAGNFGSIKNNTDSVAAINSALQYAKTKVVDGTYTPKVKIPFVGTINITSSSILFPRNVVVDMGWNRYKLADGASKYVFSQDDLATDDFVTSNGGNLEVFNFILDGNARGGQTRNLVGTDVRDMYCGFGALFFGLRFLKVHNFKCIDTEAWGFAYFKCRDTEWHTGVFDQDETRIGFNGDGITGIGSRTHIYNMAGYTNDDMFAMGTTRASIGGVQVWNDGVNIDSFNVHDIEMTDKAGRSCHFACGIYPSDGYTVKQWTMQNITGNCENGMWRCGNYFAPLGAANGLVENITEINMNGYSRTFGQGQRLIFRSNVYQLNISTCRNVVNANTSSNQFLRVVTDSSVNNIQLTGCVYQQQYTSGSREGVIHIDATSAVKQINASDVFHSLTGAQIGTPEKFTLVRNYGARPKLSLSGIIKGEANGGNLNTAIEDYWVSDTGVLMGDLNISFAEDMVLLSPNYTEEATIRACFNSGLVTLEGVIKSIAGPITIPNQLAAIQRPDWAKPIASDKFIAGSFIKDGGGAGGNEGCQVVIRNATTNIDFYHISGDPRSSFLPLNGMCYRVDPAMP
jgi:hypothetical protein